jgi:hypothetical protein
MKRFSSPPLSRRSLLSLNRDDSKGQEKRGSGKFVKRGCPASFWQGAFRSLLRYPFLASSSHSAVTRRLGVVGPIEG